MGKYLDTNGLTYFYNQIKAKFAPVNHSHSVATGLAAVGTVMPFAGDNIPEGYIVCNGAAISRTTYAALFAAIGTTYGSGDGSTTFNLPNLVDKFIQGSNTAGTVKSAGLPNVTGRVLGIYGYYTNGNAVMMTLDGIGAFYNATDRPWGRVIKTDSIPTMDDSKKDHDGVYMDLSKSNSIYGNSTTVQPPALTMRYIIKY